MLSGAALAQDDAPGAADAPALPHVTVATVQTAEVMARIAITGTLIAREEILVTPQVSGFPIEELLHDEGDRVAAGDVLARLDDRTLAAQLVQAQAELARARAAVGQAESQIESTEASGEQSAAALRRTQSLRQSGSATQGALDDATSNDLTAQAAVRAARDGPSVSQAQVQQAEAALNIATLNARNAVIRAPVGGVISERNGRIGAIATTAGASIFRIIAGGEVEMQAEVIETALGQIEVGDPVELTIAGLGNVAGNVRRISPTVDPVQRLADMRISLEDDGLRPGLFASGWIITERREAPTVPAAAILTTGDGDAVLRVSEDGVFDRVEVRAGILWNGRREVGDTLATGDRVVARAGAFFAEGDRVVPEEVGE